MWDTIGLGEDKVHQKFDEMEDFHLPDEFNNRSKQWFVAYAVSKITYLLLALTFLLILPFYIQNNPDVFSSALDVLFMIIFFFAISIFLFPLIYLIAYFRSLQFQVYSVFTKNRVLLSKDRIEMIYTVTDGWWKTKEINTMIDLDNIKGISRINDDIDLSLKYRFLKTISLEFWKPKGTLHFRMIPPRDIIVIDLFHPIEYVKYNGGRFGKRDFKYGSSDRIFIQIYKKDQYRFFETFENN